MDRLPENSCRCKGARSHALILISLYVLRCVAKESPAPLVLPFVVRGAGHRSFVSIFSLHINGIGSQFPVLPERECREN